MTLAAPRSRQGLVALVLAIVALLVAVAGIVTWSNSGEAFFPNTTLTVDQTPDTGPVAPGQEITYVVSLTVTGGDVATPASASVDLDDNLTNVTVTGSTGDFEAAPCNAVGAGNVVTCDDAGGGFLAATGASTFTVTANAPATGTVALAAVSATDADETIQGTNATGDAALDVDASGLVTVDPVGPVDNPPGTDHVITFTLSPFVACVSGVDVDWPTFDTAGPGMFTSRDCGQSDLNLNCTGAGTTAAVSSDTAPSAQSSVVTVVLSNDGTEDSCTVSLNLHANAGDDDPANNVPFTSPESTKNYTLAAAAGELRHWDIPDAETEDAFAAEDDGGLLEPQDDLDDATGSFHGACIVGGLTSADAPDITWNITALSAPPPSSVLEVAGPNGEACVRWGSNGVGTHTVTAVWDNGVAPAITFFWDAYCVEGDQCYDADDPGNPEVVVDGLELIKEWNDIDFTKIVSVDGNVGDTLAVNTGELSLNPSTARDCTDSGLCARANLDGTTFSVEGVLIIGPNGFGNLDAGGASFIDYTFGDHALPGEFYSGPVDGAEQTYSVTAGSCGSVRLEDPQNGAVIILGPGESATVLSSDKGVGFQVVPNDDGAIETTPFNASCGLGGFVTVNITTQEQNDFGSPPLDTADLETITVEFTSGPPANKQPVLLWAGMRWAVQHDWSAADGSCPWSPDAGVPFFVRYTHQSGNGAFVSDLGDGIAFGPDFMIVQVFPDSVEAGSNGPSEYDANTDCISTVIWESQDYDEIDLVAHVVEPLCPFTLNGSTQGEFDFPAGCDWSVISEQVPFLAYYMKFEEVSLGLVPGAREDHNGSSGDENNDDFVADPGPTYDPSNDVTEMTANVSADVLARVRVKGYLEKSNCPVREAGEDSNGSFLPANRCVFPDDWEHLAGGPLAEEFRPNYDIMNAPDSTFACSGTDYLSCNTSSAPGDPSGIQTGHNPAAGPFSVLDGPNPGDSSAPFVGGGFREVWLHDGDVDEWDAPMPPALVRFLLEGSGFLRPADKKDVYPNGNNPFYATHIPAEPFITPINEDLSGYQWNTWGVGSKSGPYIFWTSLADNGPEVISCPGATPCPGEGVPTGGYKMTRVYTDNHGEAMTWVNGDADLTWDDCDLNTPVPAFNISQLSGYYCENGDVVGSSTLGAVADYPDKRKHQPISSNEVTITWTWGGEKFVTIEPGATDAFNYVVLHVSDRDGFCNSITSLHPVLGERVEFTIDSPNGVIFPDANGEEAQGPPVTVSDNKKFAITHTFQASATECQAWIHVAETQELPVDVIIRAFDPEGTVTFDVLINEPPEPTPTPSPTPAPPPNLWGDIDCDGDVDSVDALGGLRYVAGFFVDQTGPCFDIGSTVSVDGSDEVFGDWDCDGDVDAVDALQVLLFVAGLDGDQTPPCPNVGAGVTIT